VLLAPEGINSHLAGEAALRGWLNALCEDPRLAGLEMKFSHCPGAAVQAPAREIQARDHPHEPAHGAPAAGRAPAVDAATLARWLAQGHCDEGRPGGLLDTRNGFEVDAGAFDGAIDWRLSRFSDFRPRCRRTATSCRAPPW
jgi:UPF0176 protein